MLINMVQYTLVYVFLTKGSGMPPMFTPCLAVPAEVYYMFKQFFLAGSSQACLQVGSWQQG
jgi:hypothetical protein